MLKQLQYRLQALHYNFLAQWVRGSNSSTIAVTRKPAIVVSPHQDDETFGCGGLIALKRQLGVPVAVAFLTNGGSAPAYNGLSWDEMLALRRQEATTALDKLGVAASDIYFLDYPDGGLTHLSDADRQSLIGQLSELCDRYQVEEAYVPHAKDAHADHEAAYQVTRSAIAKLNRSVDLYQYPIWLFWKRPMFLKLKASDLVGARRLDISAVTAKKHAAINVYESQIATIPNGFLTPYFSSSELFFLQEKSS